MRLQILLVACLSLITLGSVSMAQTSQSATEISSVTCRDVLTLTGEEKEFLIVFLHGYMLGESDVELFDADALSAITESFLNSCIDSPEASAVAVLRMEHTKAE